MANTDGLTFRPLVEGDIDAAVELDAEAGWNQIADDWRFMLSNGHGTGVTAPDGRLVATSMVLPYGDRFAWIAMILVTADWRRRGIANMLMERAIGVCNEHGWIAGLDATEAGRPVYLPHGFRDTYGITRWMIDAPDSAVPAGDVNALDDAGIERIAGWDHEVFGAPRDGLLRHLRARRPSLALAVEVGGEIAGYVLARGGRLATQIGPLVARNEDTAEELLIAVLSRCDGPVFLDAVDRHERFAARIRSLGFDRQRGYERMLLNHSRPLGRSEESFLIAGPEFA
jgi:GNAT superfamily N-acetyltransferase